ncbi:MAG: alpha/beta fold hydrolase [Myxococcota bacterium]|nr:alpha/beta fold hydrolase [Myxococcota bacterium]
MLALVGAVALAAVLPGCLQVETFFFAGRPIDEYRWDEAAEELDGDLTDAHPSLVPAADRVEGFVPLEDGTEIHWVFARRPGATATILYSHGNGPHLGRFWDRVERLWEMGFHVLVYDYPGFGRSTGTSTEAGLYASIDAVWDEVVPSIPEIDPDRTILYGYSLGGGPAFHLASRTARATRRPRAVIGESVWCSIEAQVQDGAFLDLPRELLAHLEIDNCARIAELGTGMPVTLLHGTIDTVATPRQAMLLESAARGPLELEWIPGARHAEVPNVAGDGYRETIERVVADALDPAP